MLYVTDMLLCCVCCWQHGIGLGSFNIMMNEIIKALFHAKVSQLSVGEQQWVEILKALYMDARLLILDEPTAVLTPQESERLFTILCQMKTDGLSILLITHKLHEIKAISDRVTILRKGKHVGTVNTADVSEQDLARLMVGREMDFQIARSDAQLNAPLLTIRNLCVKHSREQQALHNLSSSLFLLLGSEPVGDEAADDGWWLCDDIERL